MHKHNYKTVHSSEYGDYYECRGCGYRYKVLDYKKDVMNFSKKFSKKLKSEGYITRYEGLYRPSIVEKI